MSIKTNMRKGVVERLKTLNLDAYEDSHARLAAICRTINNPNFGWTAGACEVLRECLIYLLGGDGESNRAETQLDGGDHVIQNRVMSTKYDVVGNERHKAAYAIRAIDVNTGGFVKNLASALSIKWNGIHPRVTMRAICNRLSYLLEGIEYENLRGNGDEGTSEDDGPAVPCAAGGADCDERHQQPTEAVDPNVMSLSVRTFELDTDKAVALKVLEEAAEAFAAWQIVDECRFDAHGTCKDCTIGDCVSCHTALADELADVVQVACNLAARYNIDMGAAMKRCERRQRERGRL